MRRSGIRFGCVILLALATAGCSMGREVSSFSIDYNRAIARSRDEMLLLNIARARFREPLQFTAISSVSGSLSMSGTVEADVSSLAQWRTGGGAGKSPASISPTLTLSRTSSPTFSIQPLSDGDFTKEMLIPISPEIVDQLFKQNWDPEFILPLVIGSITCNDDTVENSFHEGRTGLSDAFADNPWTAKLIPEQTSKANQLVAAFDLPVVDAMAAAHNGVAGDYTVAITGIDKAGKFAHVEISKKPTTTWRVSGLPIKCPLHGKLQFDRPGEKVSDNTPLWLVQQPSDAKKPAADATTGTIEVQLRSIEAIIYYLGEALRRNAAITYKPVIYNGSCAPGSTQACVANTLFQARTDAPSGPVAVETTLEGQHFWIPVADEANSKDRTLTTLSMLSELIAMQTRDETKSIPQSVINVGPR